MRREALRLWLAGVLLAALDIGWTLLRGDRLFLSVGERVLYAAAALGGIAGSVVLTGLAMSAASATRLGRLLCAMVMAATSARIGWLLTAGRRVHDAPWRTPSVVGVALLAALVTFLGLAAIVRARGREAGSVGGPLTALLGAGACLAADALVLPRGYPAFHIGLFMLALACASAGGLLARVEVSRRAARALAIAGGLSVLLAPLLLARLAAHPTAGFAVREHSPWVPRMLAVVSRARAPLDAPAAPSAPSARDEPAIAGRDRVPAPGQPTRGGVDLRDRDVLLITVDALRADLLAAYGGHGGRTPVLDQLAAESAVFTRAYTPAPHTSYALVSLLTGKFMKPLVALGGAVGDPPTLPDRLRRYGYRTAAFYPPAIFFVDGSRFEPLAHRGFGFEYRKEMFASADDRVAQLDAYLEEVDPKRPLFTWVHLFEPHEPYDPPSDLHHDDSERGRYEAEVAACDRAIAKLIARFRAARPNATVIVTADHGEEFGDHGGSFHGSTLYDEQVRVPLIWSSPGAVAARRIDAPVELIDVGTTVLSTAGIPRDAHMRGDDLGGLLAGGGEAPPYAYASLDDANMITDGRMKAICPLHVPHCALFDLARDPTETRNLAGDDPATATRLRARIDDFLSSIPRSEALTVSAGVGLPEVLARAKLGVAVRVEELTALVLDTRAPVRAEAVRVLGEREAREARALLSRTRQHDEDAVVRAEAAIASLRVGDDAAQPAVAALLDPATDASMRRRAALALARRGNAEGLDELGALALDESAQESERTAAIEALAGLGSEAAVGPLSRALASVRLREAAARALGQVGGDAAREVLALQLRGERYPPARRAEAEALGALGDPRAAPLVAHLLGMESGVPGGVRLLDALHALGPKARHGVRLVDEGARLGTWRCDDVACAPEGDAAVALPPMAAGRRGAVRIVIWYRNAAPGAVLDVGGMRFSLTTPEDQVSLERPAAAARIVPFAREGQVDVVAVAVVPSRGEIPPPAPEPWDAGAPSSSDDASAR
ncbi:MAG: sulfatase-like hydrolase/transferase [Polyangiales bacterium]